MKWKKVLFGLLIVFLLTGLVFAGETVKKDKEAAKLELRELKDVRDAKLNADGLIIFDVEPSTDSQFCKLNAVTEETKYCYRYFSYTYTHGDIGINVTRQKLKFPERNDFEADMIDLYTYVWNEINLKIPQLEVEYES